VDWSLLAIRATRAEPPGQAAKGARRELYGAALQQFDELIEASRNAGHASRPLPLFYALSQAGRAVVAAHGSSGRVSSHGLAEDRGAQGPDVLRRAVPGRGRGTMPLPACARRSGSLTPSALRTSNLHPFRSGRPGAPCLDGMLICRSGTRNGFPPSVPSTRAATDAITWIAASWSCKGRSSRRRWLRASIRWSHGDILSFQVHRGTSQPPRTAGSQ